MPGAVGAGADTSHQVILSGRRTLTVDGVKDVANFDDDSIVLETTEGTLTVRGKGLKLHQLDVATGRLEASGEVDSLQYAARRRTKDGGSMLEKLWR
jgi:sporulation protein YabP